MEIMGGVPGVLGNCHLIQTKAGLTFDLHGAHRSNFTPSRARPGLACYSHTRKLSDSSSDLRFVFTKYPTSRNTRWSRHLKALGSRSGVFKLRSYWAIQKFVSGGVWWGLYWQDDKLWSQTDCAKYRQEEYWYQSDLLLIELSSLQGARWEVAMVAD